MEELQKALRELIYVQEEQAKDLANHVTGFSELWGIAKDHPEDKLSERANEITWKYWNANRGPCDRYAKRILQNAKDALAKSEGEPNA